MKKMLLILILAFFVTACQREETKQPSPAPVKPLQIFPVKELLTEAVTPAVVETMAEALPVWRQYAAGRPTLLLLTGNPAQLLSYPPQLKGEIKTLVETADQVTLRKKTIPTLANPVLLPNMAITAALDAGFFSKVIWSIPLKPETTLTLEQFRARMIAEGVFTEREAAEFRDEQGSFVGTLRGIPFTAMTSLPTNVADPILFHFDLSYLRPGYHNEIRQPINQYLRATMKKIGESRLKVISATVSMSQLSGELPLATRFVGGLVYEFMDQPQLLAEKVIGQEALRADAMYLKNFFRKNDVLNKFLAMEKVSPQDPSVKYDLYLTLLQFGRTKDAQEKLAQAVAIDPVYGLEYLDLAVIALEKGRPDGALQMYEKAAPVFPENPFIGIYKSKIYLMIGHPEKAIEVLTPLQSLTWSEIYFPQMKAEVDGLLTTAREQSKK